MKILGFSDKDIHKRRIYFRTAKAEIAEKNLHALKCLSTAAVLLYILFLCIEPFILAKREVSIYHIGFPAVAVIFCGGVRVYCAAGCHSEKTVYFLCILFWTVIFLFTTMADVFGEPSAQSCFMPFVSVALPIGFIFPVSLSFGLVGFFEILYLFGVFMFKDKAVGQYDIFCGLCSAAVSASLYFFLMHMRMRDYESCTEFEKLSRRDILMPELYNKHSGQEMIDTYIRENKPLVSGALIVLDVDDFKRINDTFGHYIGDIALRHVGAALCSEFRSTDIIARFGGDEFIVFAKGFTDEKRLVEKCRHICDRLRKIKEDKAELSVSCSIGIVRIEEDKAEDFNKLFRIADKALYEAKSRGKNCCAIKKLGESRQTYYKNHI